jgi:hypothetical protein
VLPRFGHERYAEEVQEGLHEKKKDKHKRVEEREKSKKQKSLF